MNWLKELIYNTVFTTERLKVLATKMNNDVAQSKRSGSKIVDDLMKDMYFKKGLYSAFLSAFYKVS